jgi:thiol-disulfide isomerase/thioredoxin
VLAAIVVAGGTGSVGLPALVLTATFAVGNALPLLVFALVGRGAGSVLAERVSAFRRRQRAIQIAGGITMIVLAVALVFNLPAVLQRAVPDYTVALQKAMQNGIGAGDIQRKLHPGGTAKGQLSDCAEVSGGSRGDDQLQQCGPAPAVSGITQWLNTPDGKPIDLASLRGKAVLIDFWAYSCINCQRAIGHVVDWYNRYRHDGFVVVGVHTPEYAFERVPGNVASGAAALHISYPIALDNDYQTWNNYQNLYWPAEYLIDANGAVRHIKFGEGDYSITENLIRRLLVAANPGVRLPAPGDAPDATPQTRLTPETYLGVHRAGNYGGDGEYKTGTFGYPPILADDKFALRGHWILGEQDIVADSEDTAIRLNYTGKAVYAVVGGNGTLTVIRDGKTTTTPIGGPPTLHQIVGTNPGDNARRDQLDMQVSKGLQVFSFTFG